MNLIKSIAFAAAALSCTVAIAHDGSERSSQAAQKMRIAQEVRFNEQKNSEIPRLVKSDQTPRNEPVKKSEG